MFGSFKVKAQATKGVLTIAFDDGNQNQFDNAYPLLQQYGFVGTFYVITSFLGNASFMTVPELQTLQASGDEIGSHSVDHPDFTGLTDAQINAECSESQQFLQSYGFPATDFAYPYGTHNAHTDSIVAQYYRSARSAYEGPYNMSLPPSQFVLTGYDGETYDPSTYTQAQWLYSDEVLVNDAVAQGSWVIIFFHNITTVEDDVDPFTISSANFASFLSYVQSSGVAVLTVNQALNIAGPSLSASISPTSVNLNPGGSQQFTSTVTGGVSPYTYQWFYTNGTSITGATSSTLTFKANSTGTYNIYLQASDSYVSSVQSNTATVHVTLPLNATISPTQASITLGQSQNFTASVSGGATPYAYQWVLNGSAVSGATNSLWTFMPAQTGNYNVYLNITDAFNNKAHSNTATLNVYSKPSVTIAPTSVNMTVGTSQTLSSTASGGLTPYIYQWYYANGTAITGASTSTLTYKANSTGTYNIFLNVTDSLNNKVQSNTATLNVYSQPSVTIAPTSVNMTVGITQTFTSTAIGGLVPYAYQWYLNDSAVSGANAGTWNFTTATAGTYKVYLNVTDSLSFRVQSNIVTNITVNPQSTVAISPNNVNMTLGGLQPFSSNVAGGTTPYLYQWYQNGTAVSGATSANWTFNATSVGTYNIYLNVTDNSGVTVKSNIATAGVETPMTLNITPTGVKMYVGQNQTFSSSVSGGTLPYSYQWYLNGTAVSGANGSSWTFMPASAGSYGVYLNITDLLNIKIQSNIVNNITVYPQLIASISPVSVNMTLGTQQTFSSTVSGGVLPYNYQWYLNGSKVSGATNSIWNFTQSASGTYNIYLNVTDSLSATVLSNNATAEVEIPTNVTISPTQAKMYVGQSQTFNSTVSGGTVPYSYQWVLNDVAVLGANSQNWNFTPSTAGNYKVYLNVTDALNIITQSNVASNIIVYAQLTVSINPVSVNTTIGTPQIFSSVVSGGAQPYTYQWYLNGSQVPNTNESSWSFTPTSAGNFIIYLTVADNNTAFLQSNNATLAVETLTVVAITPTHVRMYVGQSQAFNATVSGGTTPYSYQWYQNDTAISGATSQNLTYTPAAAGTYKIYLNVTDSLNIITQSNIVTDIIVYAQLTVSINPASVNMTIGIPQTFTSTISGGAMPYFYQWYLNGTAVSGATGATWTLTPATAGVYIIYLNVTDSGTTTLNSNNATAQAWASTDMVMRDQNNNIYYRTYNVTTASWTSWTALPGTTVDSPAADLINDTLYVVIRGVTSDQILFGSVNVTDNAFSGWTLLDGATPSAPTLTSNSTTLALVVRGENNAIYYKFYTIATQTWTAWTAIPTGSTIDGPAATIVSDQLHVVVRGVNSDQIWYSNLNLTDGTFSGWTLLDGSTPSAPTLTANSTTLVLVVRGENNAIYYKFYTIATQTWTSWTATPNGSTLDSPSAIITGNNLQIAVRGMNNNQIWQENLNLQTNTWSGWTLLDGATPSRPTLTS
jgi:peptidoglycan/xylan/chitin deacetylase (PgdA/CDA1 family)